MDQAPLTLGGPRPALWGVVAALAVTDAVWLSVSPLSIAPLGFGVVATVTAVLLAAAAFWTHAKPEPTLQSMALSTAYFLAFTVAAAVLHYLGATLGRPLVDAQLATAEAALGFDWQAHVAFLEAHPGLARALALAYHSSAAQIAVVVITLSALRRTARLWTYIQLFVATLLTVIVVSTLFPAKGPYAYYAGLETGTSALESIGATWHLEALAKLRSGAATSLALADVRGLATFPSFHVCLAMITAWALAPIPILGPLAILLNGAVVVATIGAGGHYLPDVLAGAAICTSFLAYPQVLAAMAVLLSRSRLSRVAIRSRMARRLDLGARLTRRAGRAPHEGEART